MYIIVTDIDIGEKTTLRSTTMTIDSYFSEFNADVSYPEDDGIGSRWVNSIYYGMTADEIKFKWDTENSMASELGTSNARTISSSIFYRWKIDSLVIHLNYPSWNCQILICSNLSMSDVTRGT